MDGDGGAGMGSEGSMGGGHVGGGTVEQSEAQGIRDTNSSNSGASALQSLGYTVDDGGGMERTESGSWTAILKSSATAALWVFLGLLVVTLIMLFIWG